LPSAADGGGKKKVFGGKSLEFSVKGAKVVKVHTGDVERSSV
jgi:hypothetical protein